MATKPTFSVQDLITKLQSEGWTPSTHDATRVHLVKGFTSAKSGKHNFTLRIFTQGGVRLPDRKFVSADLLSNPSCSEAGFSFLHPPSYRAV